MVKCGTHKGLEIFAVSWGSLLIQGGCESEEGLWITISVLDCYLVELLLYFDVLCVCVQFRGQRAGTSSLLHHGGLETELRWHGLGGKYLFHWKWRLFFSLGYRDWTHVYRLVQQYCSQYSPNIVFSIFHLFLFFAVVAQTWVLHMVGKCLVYNLFEGK